MKNTTTPKAGGQSDVLRTLAKALAPYLQDPAKPQGPEYYSQHDSPLGRRRHLKLVREGTLLGHKVGKLVLARRDEVHRFIEQHPSGVERNEHQDNVLRDWGLTSGGRP